MADRHARATTRAPRLADFAGLPAAEFIRHRAPMLLLDTILDVGEQDVRCEFTVPFESPLVQAGKGFPAYLGIEIMAQSVAVLSGTHARRKLEPPPIGFLLGTRQFTCRVPYFACGETLTTHCREIIRDAQGMASFDCRIIIADEVVAEAALAVFERNDLKELPL